MVVVYVLSLQADALDGVAAVTWKPDADVCLSVRNPVDPTQVRERVVIDTSALEEEPVTPDHHQQQHQQQQKHHDRKHQQHRDKKHHQHHEAPCHFALTWDGATERSTIRVRSATEEWERGGGGGKKGKQHKQQVNAPELATALTESGTAVPLLALECENVEPYALHLLGTELVVTTTAGKTYEQLQWQYDDNGTCSWEAYDMASGSTSIVNLKATFE